MATCNAHPLSRHVIDIQESVVKLFIISALLIGCSKPTISGPKELHTICSILRITDTFEECLEYQAIECDAGWMDCNVVRKWAP